MLFWLVLVWSGGVGCFSSLLCTFCPPCDVWLFFCGFLVWFSVFDCVSWFCVCLFFLGVEFLFFCVFVYCFFCLRVGFGCSFSLVCFGVSSPLWCLCPCVGFVCLAVARPAVLLICRCCPPAFAHCTAILPVRRGNYKAEEESKEHV